MKCVSLFSGCGGLDLGLTQAGFDISLAVESDRTCVASYRANFPKAHVHQGGVEDLTSELMADASDGETLGEIDLLAGGPPCPPYSKSRFYRKEKPRALDDPLGWATLRGYVRVLEALRPRAFLLENVAGLAYDVHRPALELIKRKAANLGYVCDYRVACGEE
jgi:DNA (cytosine-5)-methyltransferase 1